MSWANSEIVSVFIFLLPGFVAATVFYSFTAYPKPNEFGQVVQALVFTMVGQVIAGSRQHPTARRRARRMACEFANYRPCPKRGILRLQRYFELH